MSVLALNNISFSYGKKPVLSDLSYEFEKGKMYCIAGKSGAGKTTLLSILSGLASPDKGSIIYNGKDIKDIDKYKFRSEYIGVFRGLANDGKCVILVSHSAEVAELCDEKYELIKLQKAKSKKA